jgi:putative hydrolase of the HAD superfamily
MSGPPFHVSHILFDVDGTLVDFYSVLTAALQVTAEFTSEVTGTLVTSAQLRSARELVYAEPDWRRRTLREVRDESLRRVLAAAGQSESSVWFRVSEAYYETRDGTMLPHAETDEVLVELKRRMFTLIAGTNGNAPFGRYQFTALFEVIHQADQVGASKPDAGFYHGALERAGARSESTVSVGDSVVNDVDGAVALGMSGIFLDRANAAPDIDVPRITTLRELPDLVELA